MQRVLPFAQRNLELRIVAANALVECAVDLGAESVDSSACAYMDKKHEGTYPSFIYKSLDHDDLHVTFGCKWGSAYQNAYQKLPVNMHTCKIDYDDWDWERFRAGKPYCNTVFRTGIRSVESNIEADGRLLRDALRDSTKRLLFTLENSTMKSGSEIARAKMVLI